MQSLQNVITYDTQVKTALNVCLPKPRKGVKESGRVHFFGALLQVARRGGEGNWIGDSSSADSEKMLSVGRKKRKSIFTAFITNCDSNLLQKGVSFLRDRGLICIGCLCENGKNVGSWEMDVLRV